MTKIPFMRLSLLALIALGLPVPSHAEKKSREIQGQTYCLPKNQINRIPLRVLPPCPPAPVSPGGSLVPTQNPDALPGAFFPNASAANALVAPPQTLASFGSNNFFIGGDQSTNSEWPSTPPDTMGAVGPEQFIVAINPALTSFDKSGNRDNVLDVAPDAFMNLDGNFSLFVDMSDPHIQYDKLSNRWYYIFLNQDVNGNAQPNGFSLAVSDSDVISNSTKWTVLNIFNATLVPDQNGCPGDQGLFFDFPLLGIDNNAVYTSFNMFDIDGTYLTSTAFVIQKSSLLVDGPVYVTVFRDVIGIVNNPLDYRESAVTLCPATNFDANAQFGYYISQDPDFFGLLNLYRVVNPESRTPTLEGPFNINVPATSSLADPANTPWQGNLFGILGTLDHGDDRFSSATIRNGQLYTCQTILVNASGVGTQSGDRAAQRWYQIDVTGGGTETATTQPVLVQAGTLFDASLTMAPLWYTYGTVAANRRGDLVLGCSVMGLNQSPSCCYVGRLAGDPLGTLRIGNPPPSIYAAGSGGYSRLLGQGSVDATTGQRWGDYSYTSVDPVDDLTFWTIQERVFQSLEQVVVAKLVSP